MYVKNLFVMNAWPVARHASDHAVKAAWNLVANAKNSCVLRVLKIIYVLLANKKWRTMKMKTNKSNQKNPPKETSSKLHRYSQPVQPTLRFSPTAWAKLLFFRDCGETEISGFGITAPDDLLYVTDFITIKQDTTVASISLDDEAVADFFETQVDTGRKPQEFFRIWCHTHPGNSPTPSSTDEETFQRVFGRCEWAVMFIMARDGRTYTRLRFNTGPGGQVLIPVQIDYSRVFGQTDRYLWEAEYKANIKVLSWLSHDDTLLSSREEYGLNEFNLSQDILEQFEEMAPAERKAVMDELAARPELWSDVDEEVSLYD
jgi:hypothetical protein